MMPGQSAVARATSGGFRIACRSATSGTLTTRLIGAALPLGLALAGVAAAESARPVLTVYTYSSFAGEYGPGATIKERFETTCACSLEWVTSDDAGTLLARLKLEG